MIKTAKKIPAWQVRHHTVLSGGSLGHVLITAQTNNKIKPNIFKRINSQITKPRKCKKVLISLREFH
ncbi:hypothetical protein [Shewanella sp. NFH-SH190041]|uniref:hypothetical protein n=1 Tax=Shewanella sp. NFH-SH190041 TaxID=2950245 RepID=UPI0021C39DA7|nr:hypothetical protein [Shewanella sp. NFH-SH190041]